MKRFAPSRILVPVDFSKPSLAALDLAKRLARRWGSALDVLYVQDVPLSLAGFGAPGEAAGAPALLREMREFAQWRADKLRRAAAGGRTRVRVLESEGPPAGRILQASRAPGVGLIVMGTHGHRGLGRVLFGSTAEAVVRGSRVPVLTLRARRARLSRVLAPFNFTPYAAAALVRARDVSRALGGRLAVLCVVERRAGGRALLRRRLAGALGARAAAGLRLIVSTGDPRAAIGRAAARGRFDLVVLSAHRSALLSAFTLGSTAENVLRRSRVPVLSVPSEGRLYDRGKRRALAQAGPLVRRAGRRGRPARGRQERLSRGAHPLAARRGRARPGGLRALGRGLPPVR